MLIVFNLDKNLFIFVYFDIYIILKLILNFIVFIVFVRIIVWFIFWGLMVICIMFINFIMGRSKWLRFLGVVFFLFSIIVIFFVDIFFKCFKIDIGVYLNFFIYFLFGLFL